MAWVNPWLMVFRHLPRVPLYSLVVNMKFFTATTGIRTPIAAVKIKHANHYTIGHKRIHDELLDSDYQLSSLKKEYQLDDDIGRCQSSIDKTLKEFGVERQAYLDGCIVDNHCDKLLKEGNIDILYT